LSFTIRISRDLRDRVEKLIEIGEYRSLREAFDDLIKLGLTVRDSGVKNQIELKETLKLTVDNLKREVGDLIKMKKELQLKVDILKLFQNINVNLQKIVDAGKCDEEILDILMEIKKEIYKIKDLYFSISKKTKK